MRKSLIIATGIGAALAVTAVGAAMTGAFEDESAQTAAFEADSAVVASEPRNCRSFATAETGFDPATTPVPVQQDAGNKQVLKGTAVGAAIGAVAGEVIGDKAGYGAAAGAAAGAAGGQAVKADKQQKADARYAQESAYYQQQKTAYDAALAECLAD
ncbi:YMGG-like glycine zipper-containing protein [Marinicaulis aureus]|uniref:YMGG-like glycine zipper-containing protein n=1 Tax=Hyphococcus aureus TaxID=2666033 RepID=A0ABW1KWF8_9PROT